MKQSQVVAPEVDLSGLLRARRILVLGSPGSGKTHLSSALSRLLGLPLLRLDDHFWKPGPVRLPTDAWRARVVELCCQPDWIMDGTYEASLDLRLPLADAIVYIESNRWACLWRVIRRRLSSRRGGAKSGPGHALTGFFVRYVFRFPTSTRPEVWRLVAEHASDKPLVVLDGALEVDRFIQRLQRRTADAVALSGTPASAVEFRNGRA